MIVCTWCGRKFDGWGWLWRHQYKRHPGFIGKTQTEEEFVHGRAFPPYPVPPNEYIAKDIVAAHEEHNKP